MKSLYIAVIAFIALPCFARSHAPLPPALLEAKTVYFMNETGAQQTVDSAYEEIQKWGKLTVAPSKSGADMVMVFTSDGRLIDGTTYRYTQMTVFLPGNDDPVFEAKHRDSRFRPGKSAKNCVDDLQHRMEDK